LTTAEATFTGTGAGGGTIVISQVYGGGGNAGALWRQDFVELFNRTNAPISINGWSLQYQAAGTTGAYAGLYNLPNVSIPAYSYYLVRCAGGAGGTDILVADTTTCALNLSGTAGKIAVVRNTTAIASTTILPDVNVSDLIGFGGTANQFEGATAPAPSNTTSLRRGSAGCTDTDANNTNLTTFTLTGVAGTDFRNTGTAANTCP
jgi:predicted extracellular nuclease